MTTATTPEPAMAWNDIINSYHLRDGIRQHADQTYTIYRPYYRDVPAVAVSQRITKALIADLDHGVAISAVTPEDLKLQAGEIIGLTDQCIADANDPDHIREADIRDAIIALQQDHAQVLAQRAHSTALMVGPINQDSPMRRHMLDSAQYALAVAGTIIKAGRAIYDAHDVSAYAGSARPE